ncbi:Leucine-Rich Repeat-Containing Protein 3 [Manis pentadactyla]|nr:Leucine-Rich Repeat-Containing Protein 3 [Manis pentadactyla]
MVSEVGFKQDPLNGSEAEQELVPTELAELTTFLLTLAFETTHTPNGMYQHQKLDEINNNHIEDGDGDYMTYQPDDSTR